MITGAAQGIGAEIAASFHREGAVLALVDRDGRRLAATAETLSACSIVVDLADPDAARAAARDAIAAIGGIDILVNNAGVFKTAPLLDIEVDDWDLIFAVNVRAMLITTQVAAARMIADGGGRIINMASMGGKEGDVNQAHYAASKAAVISLTRVSAKELGAHNITVNCICPGYVLTEMGAANRTEAMIREWSAKSPLGRLARPSDVANMAVFLASEEASYCTGQAMNVTGGMVMW